MNQSTEGKIRSKYQSSTRKIKELYTEFESLKSRINTPSKNKKLEMSIDYSHHDRSFTKVESQQFWVPTPQIPIQRRLFAQTSKATIDFQTQTLIKNSFKKFWTTSLVQLDKRVDERCNLLEGRVQNMKQLLVQLGRLMKLKSDNVKLMKVNKKCNCKWKGEEVKEVEEKYRKKMDQMIGNYEHKISLLVKENNTSASSVSVKIPKQIEEEMKNLQQKLLIKEKQITQLKLQGSRLRRQSDNNCRLLRDKEKLVDELTQEIKDKETDIKQLNERLTDKNDKQLKFHKKESEIMVKKLNQEIDRLNEINQILQSEVNKMQKIENEEISKNESKRKHSKDHKQIEWNQSEIHHHSYIVSEGDQQMGNQLKIDEDFEPLRHSHFVFKNNKNKSYFLEQKIKELESQLQLISEENRLLKDKKDKFEEQVKENQSDEEKFQMQSQILREQLKRMNVSLRNLDQCAVSFLKDKKVDDDKIAKLDDNLNFKKELTKKFPQRKASISKSIK